MAQIQLFHFVRLSAAVVPLLAACSDSDSPETPALDPARYITFETPVLKVESRTAADGFLDAFPADGAFGVFGYCLSQNVINDSELSLASGTAPWSGKNERCRPRVFNNVEVTFNGSGCTYRNPAQWYYDGAATGQQGISDTEAANADLTNTDNYLYSFFAYYPYRTATYTPFAFSRPVSNEDTGAPKFRFSMPFSGGSYQTMLDDSQTPDAMLAVNYNRRRSESSIPLTFYHLLTGLGFQVNNYSQTTAEGETTGNAGENLYIYSIRLRGTFFRSIDVDLANAQVKASYDETDTYKGYYSLFEAPEGRLVSWDASDKSNTLAPEKYIRLLPGNNRSQGYLGPADKESGKWDGQVLVDYRFGSGERKTEAIDRPSSFAPRSGMRYTAQLNWVGNAFVVMVQADNSGDWAEGSDDDVIFQ